MRIFLTGASGYIGSAVTRELVEGGHEVTGMFHAADSEERVRSLGAKVVRGELTDPATYAEIAGEQEALIHLAFDRERTVEADRAALDTLIEAGRTHVTVEEARGSLGPVADALVLDQALVTRRAEEIGWRPRHPSFVQSAGAAWRELHSTSPGAGGS